MINHVEILFLYQCVYLFDVTPKDELTMTTHSYEAQLSMMSEHLCGLNDKLTSQRDEIDSLKLKSGKKKK